MQQQYYKIGASGPADNKSNQLVNQESRIYEINKKYQDYINELGVKRVIRKTNPWEKMNIQQPIRDNNGLIGLYAGLQRKDITMPKLIVDPERVSPILKAVQDENLVLRDEIEKISSDLITFSQMIMNLIEDNQALNQHMQQRSINQEKHIEQIQNLKQDEIQDLRQYILSLQEENNILMKHIEELKLQIIINNNQSKQAKQETRENLMQ